MKSTLKIDYERGHENNPVIKIIIPGYDENPDVWFDNMPINADHDVRDKLMHDFIHSPLYSEPNSLFEVKSASRTSAPNSIFVTTIGPVKNDRILYKLRHVLLNREVPYETLCVLQGELNRGLKDAREELEGEVKAKRINEFFDWLDGIKS